MINVVRFQAAGLLLAALAGCSRQRPAVYPPSSAASIEAKAAPLAALTRAFQDDVSASTERVVPTPKEQHRGHQH
jgi:predicted small lipoprotein YifL